MFAADRHRLLIIAMAIVLIPILLTMTPLSLLNKFGGSISEGHHLRRAYHLLSNSIGVEQDDISIVGLPLTSKVKTAKVLLDLQAFNSISVLSSLFSEYVPLRC